MHKVELLYRIDIGFNSEKGYAAAIADIKGEKQKGIKGNSMEQLTSRIRHALLEVESKRRMFPLESEPSRIITPN